MPSLHLDESISERASQLLPQNAYDYFAGSAGDERTYSANLNAFRDILFRPRCLVPVSKVDTSVTVPGIGKLSAPIIAAPMAMQCMAHPDGEMAVARALKTLGLGLTLSTFSTVSMEDIAQVGPPRVFQLYLYKDRSISLRLVQRAKKAGYTAIVLTVDAPRFGRRERDRNNSFHLPPHLTLANFPRSSTTKSIATAGDHESALDGLSLQVDPDLSPEALRWLIRVSGLPVWVKGLLRGDDARIAVEAGAAAIVVSNHGARQLEGAIPSMQALPEVVDAVKGRVPVLVDSGVRTGEDIVRACALGAQAVLIGRPLLWALAEGGEKGVLDYFREMKNNVELAMALCGATSVKKITRDMVITPSANHPQRACKL